MAILQDLFDTLLYDWWYTDSQWVFLMLFVTLIAGGLVSLLSLSLLWLRVLFYAFGRGLPRCGRCGYIVRGIGSLGCPECGADLREAGIVTGRQRFRVGALAFVMWWSTLLLLSAAVGSTILIAAGPRDAYTGEYLSAVLPAAGADLQVSNDAADSPSDVPPPVRHLDLWIDQSNAMSAASYMGDVDVAKMTFLPFNTPNAPPAAMDREAILAWWKPWGTDLDDPAVIAEADELLRLLREAPQGGLDAFSSSIFEEVELSVWTYERPAGWFAWLQLPMWAAIWLAGVVLYVLLQRRSHRRETAGALPPPKPVPPTTPTPQP